MDNLRVVELVSRSMGDGIALSVQKAAGSSYDLVDNCLGFRRLRGTDCIVELVVEL